MTRSLLSQFLMWCSIISFSWLLLVSVVFMTAANRIYRIHCRWFPIPRETFDTILYGLIGLFKILIIVLFIIPWIAISLTG